MPAARRPSEAEAEAEAVLVLVLVMADNTAALVPVPVLVAGQAHALLPCLAPARACPRLPAPAHDVNKR